MSDIFFLDFLKLDHQFRLRERKNLNLGLTYDVLKTLRILPENLKYTPRAHPLELSEFHSLHTPGDAFRHDK